MAKTKKSISKVGTHLLRRTATLLKKRELGVRVLPMEWLEIVPIYAYNDTKRKNPGSWGWRQQARNGHIICHAFGFNTRVIALKIAMVQNSKFKKKLKIFDLSKKKK